MRQGGKIRDKPFLPLPATKSSFSPNTHQARNWHRFSLEQRAPRPLPQSATTGIGGSSYNSPSHPEKLTLAAVERLQACAGPGAQVRNTSSWLPIHPAPGVSAPKRSRPQAEKSAAGTDSCLALSLVSSSSEAHRAHSGTTKTTRRLEIPLNTNSYSKM